MKRGDNKLLQHNTPYLTILMIYGDTYDMHVMVMYVIAAHLYPYNPYILGITNEDKVF